MRSMNPLSSRRPAVVRIEKVAHSTRSASGRSASSGSRSHHCGRSASPMRTSDGWSSRHSSSRRSVPSRSGPPLDAFGGGPRLRARRRLRGPRRGAARRRSSPVRCSSASDRGDDAGRPAGSPRSRSRRRGPLDRGRQLGIGEVPVVRAEPQRARPDGVAEPILRRRLAEVERHRRRPSARDSRWMTSTSSSSAAAPATATASSRSGSAPSIRTTAPAARLQRPGGRRHARGAGPSPRRPRPRPRGPEERLEAQRLGRLAAEQPGGGEVLEAQLVDGRGRRRRAEDEVDAVGRQVLADDGRPAADPQHVGRRHAAELVRGRPRSGPVRRSRPSAAIAVRTSLVRRLEERARRSPRAGGGARAGGRGRR